MWFLYHEYFLDHVYSQSKITTHLIRQHTHPTAELHSPKLDRTIGKMLHKNECKINIILKNIQNHKKRMTPLVRTDRYFKTLNTKNKLVVPVRISRKSKGRQRNLKNSMHALTIK